MSEPDPNSFWRKEIPLWRKPRPRDEDEVQLATEDSQPPAEWEPAPSAAAEAAEPPTVTELAPPVAAEPPVEPGPPRPELRPEADPVSPQHTESREPLRRVVGPLAASPVSGPLKDTEDFGTGLRTRLGPGEVKTGVPSPAPQHAFSVADVAGPWQEGAQGPPRAQRLQPTLAETTEDEIRIHQLLAALAERDATLIELGGQLEERQARLAEAEAKLRALGQGSTDRDAEGPRSLGAAAAPDDPAPATAEGPAEAIERLMNEMGELLDEPAGPNELAIQPAAADEELRLGGMQGPRWRVEQGQEQAPSVVVSYGEGLELRFAGQSAVFLERLLRATDHLQALGEMLRAPGAAEAGQRGKSRSAPSPS